MRYLIVVLFFMCSNLSNAQNYEEVVYLNNGSIIRGIIIEFVPSQTIKIQSREGNIFVYNLSEIQKITKEHFQQKFFTLFQKLLRGKIRN